MEIGLPTESEISKKPHRLEEISRLYKCQRVMKCEAKQIWKYSSLSKMTWAKAYKERQDWKNQR